MNHGFKFVAGGFLGLVLSVGCSSDESSSDGAPTARITGPTAARLNELVTLDGSQSVGTRPLTYSWSLDERPGGSAAGLGSNGRRTVSFTPDVAGRYVVSLLVQNAAGENMGAWTVDASEGGDLDAGRSDGSAAGDGSTDGGASGDGSTDGGNPSDGSADGGASGDGSTDGGASGDAGADGGAQGDGGVQPDAAVSVDCATGCTCPSGSSCQFSCAGGGCGVSFSAGSSGTVSCTGGSCNVTCGAGANCSSACPNGNCFMNCGLNATCEMECEGMPGSCQMECIDATTCRQECDQGCSLICNNVMSCTQTEECDVLNGGCTCQGCTS